LNQPALLSECMVLNERHVMGTTTIKRAILLSLCLAATLSLAACATAKSPVGVGAGNGHPASPTAAAARVAATPSATSGAASDSAAPQATAWLAASEIPFGATYTWSLVAGNGSSAPIGTSEGKGVYYVSPDTVFQAITSCGDPSLLMSNILGARQRLFDPTTGALRDQAGQWISSYPDAAAAQAAWHGLQAAYAGCRAHEPSPQITLTETAQNQDGMAWFDSTKGAIADLAPYIHEYFVLNENEIAYVFVRGSGPALAATPDDAQVLATIAQHLSS
jgi:hypothetical protein